MKRFKLLLLNFILLLFAATPTANAQVAEGGAFSSYLIGTYEARQGVHTLIQVVNPTRSSLEFVMGFFDVNGNFLTCVEGRIEPNGMREVFAPASPNGKPNIGKDHCVVKIISHKQGKPTPGIVGFQSKVSTTPQGNAVTKTMSESLLASVPIYYAKEELAYILSLCQN